MADAKAALEHVNGQAALYLELESNTGPAFTKGKVIQIIVAFLDCPASCTHSHIECSCFGVPSLPAAPYGLPGSQLLGRASLPAARQVAAMDRIRVRGDEVACPICRRAKCEMVRIARASRTRPVDINARGVHALGARANSIPGYLAETHAQERERFVASSRKKDIIRLNWKKIAPTSISPHLRLLMSKPY